MLFQSAELRKHLRIEAGYNYQSLLFLILSRQLSKIGYRLSNFMKMKYGTSEYLQFCFIMNLLIETGINISLI